MSLVAGVPIKPFHAAKHRLSAVLPRERRRALARYLAGNTLRVVANTGLEVVVLSANDEVGAFARDLGHQVQLTPRLNLNEATTRFVAEVADGRPWLLLHADLAYLTVDALQAAIARFEAQGAVIAPSPDGGTPLLGARGRTFDFAYGPGSFHRHLRSIPSAAVIVDPRLSCDLDRPRDLEAARGRLKELSTLLRS
jgi:2-phospho-L-lactate guanylyltransferase